jgi:hypothetical protein
VASLVNLDSGTGFGFRASSLDKTSLAHCDGWEEGGRDDIGREGLMSCLHRDSEPHVLSSDRKALQVDDGGDCIVEVVE